MVRETAEQLLRWSPLSDRRDVNLIVSRVAGAEFFAVHAWFPDSGGLCRAEGVSPERAEHHRPGAALQDPERH